VFQRPYTETENPQEKITERQFFERLIQIEDYGG
jgi:hypothetical protein